MLLYEFFFYFVWCWIEVILLVLFDFRLVIRVSFFVVVNFVLWEVLRYVKIIFWVYKRCEEIKQFGLGRLLKCVGRIYDKYRVFCEMKFLLNQEEQIGIYFFMVMFFVQNFRSYFIREKVKIQFSIRIEILVKVELEEGCFLGEQILFL